MSAKESLRHPWIMKHRKIPQTPAASRTNLLLDRPAIGERGVGGRTGYPSCLATPNLNKRNLRKYLSKSREALFEKVISQHRLASEIDKKENGNLRKSTLLSQYNKTRRLCESQMNLISKSRERQLVSEQGMSPNFSKSREKLYGLRSLSKSHEVLNLGLCTKMIKPTNTCDTKQYKLSRTGTPDLSALPNDFLSVAKANSTSQVDQELSKRITMDEDVRRGIIKATDWVENEENSNKGTNETGQGEGNKHIKEKQKPSKLRQDDYDDKENSAKSEKISKSGLKGPVVETESEEKDSRKKNELSKDNESTESTAEVLTQGKGKELDDDLGAGSSSTDSDDSLGSCENMSELVSSTVAADGRGLVTGAEEETEPRFTVQQLISAYNLHQEVITKTSIEVTMTKNDNQENKIIPNSILGTSENRKFPTGPNALRLFIPDIDIALRRTKKRSSQKCHITSIAEREENDADSETQTVVEAEEIEIISCSSLTSVSPSLNELSRSECTSPDPIVHDSALTPSPTLADEKKTPLTLVDMETNTFTITCSTAPSKVKEYSKNTEVSASLENIFNRVDDSGSETTTSTSGSSTAKRNQPSKLSRSLTESNMSRTQLCSTSFLRTLDKFNNMINEEVKMKINKPSPKIRRKSNPVLMNKPYF